MEDDVEDDGDGDEHRDFHHRTHAEVFRGDGGGEARQSGQRGERAGENRPDAKPSVGDGDVGFDIPITVVRTVIEIPYRSERVGESVERIGNEEKDGGEDKQEHRSFRETRFLGSGEGNEKKDGEKQHPIRNEIGPGDRAIHAKQHAGIDFDALFFAKGPSGRVVSDGMGGDKRQGKPDEGHDATD